MTSDSVYVTHNGQSLEYDGIFLKHSMPVPDQFITMFAGRIGLVDKCSGNSKTARKSVVINGTKKQKVTEKVHQAATFQSVKSAIPHLKSYKQRGITWFGESQVGMQLEFLRK